MSEEKEKSWCEKQKMQESAESQKLMSACPDGNKPATAAKQVRVWSDPELRREELEATSHSGESFCVKNIGTEVRLQCVTE